MLAATETSTALPLHKHLCPVIGQHADHCSSSINVVANATLSPFQAPGTAVSPPPSPFLRALKLFVETIDSSSKA